MIGGYPDTVTDRRTFGQTIREARLAKGMSMGQLAAAVERSTASVRRWERDQGVPAATVVHELTVVLNLDEAETVALAAAPLPDAPPPPSPPAEPSDATRATSVPTTSAAPSVIPPTDQSTGWVSALRDPEKPWLGYLRATLTVVILLILAWVLIWALGGFLDAYSEIWESLWVDAA